MQRSTISKLTFWSLLGIAVAAACTPHEIDVPDDEDDGDNGNGNGGTGATYTGGFSGTAYTGGYSTGGYPTGGFATGGVSGTFATGGTLPTGGAVATGGTFPTGGTPATGGTFPTGGTLTGGVTSTGGTLTGGATATGGAAGASSVTCDAAFAVGSDGFVRAPGAAGCMHGYAYAGGDTGSMVMPTTFGTCGMGCMLHVSGTLGPANAANSYAGVAFLGFNVNQAAGSSTFSTMAPTGTSLVVTYTKTAGPAMIRVQVQAGTSRWCANLTASPATIPYTMFNTACWDGTGTAYAKQPIEAIQLVAPGGETAGTIDMTLVSVKDM